MRASLSLVLLGFGQLFAVAAPQERPTAPAQSAVIEDLTWTEVRDAIAAGKTTAIYYAGSTEQNGPHMALGKHNFIARYVSQRIAEQLGNALVYPVMPFGPTGDVTTKTNHMRFSGSISVSPDTFGAVAHEVALSAIAAGFKNVVLMGDHGGDQEPLKKVAETLDSDWSAKGVHVYYIPDLYYKEKEQMREYLTKRNMRLDEHAGIDDTSELMSIDTDNKWIRKEKLAPDNGKMGVEGDPTQASAELGKMFINWKIQDAVAQIRSLVGGGVPPVSQSTNSTAQASVISNPQRTDTPFSRQIDSAVQGFWTLNVEKSDFGGRPKPKMGLVNWGEHGWTFALVTADGRLFADGVSTDRGCALIGMSPNYSCEVDVVTPRHVRFTLEQGTTIRRIGDIEFLEDGTTQTTHRVTPADGAPYVEKTIWEKQVRK